MSDENSWHRIGGRKNWQRINFFKHFFKHGKELGCSSVKQYEEMYEFLRYKEPLESRIVGNRIMKLYPGNVLLVEAEESFVTMYRWRAAKGANG